MNTPQERLDFLVHYLEDGDARSFAGKCGMHEAQLSRMRHGKEQITMLSYTRILRAYPQVRRQWLFAGEGEPTKEKQEKNLILSELSALRDEVAELKEMVANLEKSTER